MKSEHIALGLGILLLFTRRRSAGIGAIYDDVPLVYECNDGTFSTAETTRGCHRHGGRKSNTPIQVPGRGGSGLLNIIDVPLKDIKIDRALFQGREKAFSRRSVDNIVNDAMSGRFEWENLDPITIWKSEEGKLFLLSGHSRLEGFKVLSAEGVTVDGKGFDRIPAKIRTGSLQAAQKMALESNTLSTKETDIERAAYYRRLRQDGEPEKQILAAIKKNEGRNWTNIYAFTFLNPDGRAWATIRQFSDGEDQSAILAKSLAKWIGVARRDFPFLTNQHENEIYTWLFENRGYGTGSGQVSSEREFMERLAVFIQKNTFFGEFDAEKPLNIQAAQLKSPTELEYDRAIQDRTREIVALERDVKRQTKELGQKGASRADVARIIEPLERQLRNLRLDLSRLHARKDEIIEYSKREATLFGYRKRKLFN